MTTRELSHAEVNDPRLVAKLVTTLEGLHRFAKGRRDAYEAGLTLQTLCVLGRFLFDENGRCAPFTENIPADLYRVHAAEPEKRCPAALTEHELDIFMRGEFYTVESYRVPYASPDAGCDVCGKHWTLEDCHDFVRASRIGGPIAHYACYRKRAAAEQRVAMAAAFLAAGYQPNLITIPNEYWGMEKDGRPPYYAAPWYLAQVGEGHVFKVGWRKRVISVDWSESGIELPDLFEYESVTKDRFLVHAYGYEKLSEYLKRIVPALSR